MINRQWGSLLPTALLWLSGWGLQAQSNLDKAQTAFEGRNYPQAIQYYEMALQEGAQVQGNDAQANLAKAYQFCAQFDKAQEWYARVVQDPASPHIYTYYYAEMLKINGEYEQARKLLDAYALKQPDLARNALRSLDFAEKNKNMRSAFRVSPESLVNSKGADYAPAFFGDKLLFSSTRVREMKSFGGYSDGKLSYWYSAERSATGTLKAAEVLESKNPIAIPNNLSPVAISTESNKIAVSSHQFLPGIRHFKEMFKTMGLEIAVESDMSKYAQGDAFPHFQNNAIGFPSMTRFGTVLYFSAEHPSGYGGFDIYVSRFENGRWSVPMNLGPEVNTIGDEVAPFIADDGKLYFSSDFHPGFGAFDVFRTEYVDDTWVNVRNLGPEVNSPFDDMYFVYDNANNVGYFSSNRAGGKGDYDIYSAKWVGPEAALALVGEIVLPPKTESPDKGPFTPPSGDADAGPFAGDPNTPAQPVPPSPGAQKPAQPAAPPSQKPIPSPNLGKGKNEAPCPTNIYIGSIVDAQTNMPLEDVTVFLRNDHKKTEAPVKFMSNRYGEYACQLDPMTTYTLGMSKPGYENETFSIKTETGARKTILGQRNLRRSATFSNDVFPDMADNGMQARGAEGDPNAPALPAATPSERRFSLRPQEPLPLKAYQVQVANLKKLDDAWLERLSVYGNVLSERNGRLMRYTLGVYAEEQHAREVLAEMKKMGFKDAFLRNVELDPNDLSDRLSTSNAIVYPLLPEPAPLPEPQKKGTAVLPPAPIDPGPFAGDDAKKENWADNGMQARGGDFSMPQVQNIEFKVQLGAFRIPEGVDFKELADLGIIQKQQLPNGLTAFYLGGYNSFEEAKTANQKAKERGQAGSFLVALRNGQRIDIKEALK